jgi:hypothetical protein
MNELEPIAGVYYLGRLCKRGHEWRDSGRSLRRQSCHGCIECNRKQAREYRKTPRGEEIQKRAIVAFVSRNPDYYRTYCKSYYWRKIKAEN